MVAVNEFDALVMELAHDRANLHFQVVENEQRIEQLEAENAALREFVRAVDQTALSSCDCIERWEWDSLAETRHVLADDYGIPLPGQEGKG